MCKNKKLQGLVGRRKKINKKKKISTHYVFEEFLPFLPGCSGCFILLKAN